MGIKLFAKKIYRGEKKENKLFMGSMILIIAFMYNVMNTYYNEAIYDIAPGKMYVSYINKAGQATEIYQPIGNIIKTNIFLILGITCIVGVLMTAIFIKEKHADIACAMYSGGTYKDALNFLIYTTLRALVTASILGSILGMLASPIYNLFLYMLIGNKGAVFTFYSEGFFNLILFIVLFIIAGLMINFGFVYRKDVMGLIRLSGEKRVDDKRLIKVPAIIYFLIYFAPVIYAITLPTIKGSNSLICVMSYGSVAVLYGMSKYGLDEAFAYMKKKKFMYKKNRIIYISGAIKAIKQSVPYMIVFIVSLVYTIDNISEMVEYNGVLENLTVCMIGTIAVISIGIGYKIIIEFKDIKIRANQLRQIGFSDEQIIKCVNSEVITIFAFTTIVPLAIIAGNLIVCSSVGILTIPYGITLMLGVVIPPNIVGFVCTTISSNVVKKALEKKSKRNIVEGEMSEILA